jgi:hypothetical protein
MAFMLLIISVLGIASNAIGIRCLGSDDSKKSDKGYLLFMLVFSIVTTLLSIYYLFKKAKEVGVAGLGSAIYNPGYPGAR